MRRQLPWMMAAAVIGMACGESTSPGGEDPDSPTLPPPSVDAGPAMEGDGPASPGDDGSAGDPPAQAVDGGAAGGSLPDAAASGSDASTVVDPVTGELGSACESDADCDGEMTCFGAGEGDAGETDTEERSGDRDREDTTEFSRGYCTSSCGLEDGFGGSDVCGESGSCILLPGTRQLACALRCETDADCRPDYSCQRARSWPEDGRYCLPAPDESPREPRDEPLDEEGDGEADGEDRVLADTGSPCARGADCAGGLCLTWLPGGYCSEPCDLEADPDPCGAGAECVNGDLRGGVCAQSCTADTQCRPGYECGPWSSWGDEDGAASGDVCTASSDRWERD